MFQQIERSSEFPTASAAENACEEKTGLTCGRCRSGAEAKRNTLVERYSSVTL